MAKKAPAKRAPAKRKPRPKKPVVTQELIDSVIEFNAMAAEKGILTRKSLDCLTGKVEIYQIEAPVPIEPTDDGKPVVVWRSVFSAMATVIPLVLSLGMGWVLGVYSAGGVPIGPGPIVRNDSLSQAHVADRVSQVRILREYAGKTFPNEPEAQKWLNEQRIAARITDWIPYTDELGTAADSGVEAVKALADRLEGK
jgi:hypothetical protein